MSDNTLSNDAFAMLMSNAIDKQSQPSNIFSIWDQGLRTGPPSNPYRKHGPRLYNHVTPSEAWHAPTAETPTPGEPGVGESVVPSGWVPEREVREAGFEPQPNTMYGRYSPDNPTDRYMGPAAARPVTSQPAAPPVGPAASQPAVPQSTGPYQGTYGWPQEGPPDPAKMPNYTGGYSGGGGEFDNPHSGGLMPQPKQAALPMDGGAVSERNDPPSTHDKMMAEETLASGAAKEGFNWGALGSSMKTILPVAVLMSAMAGGGKKKRGGSSMEPLLMAMMLPKLMSGFDGAK